MEQKQTDITDLNPDLLKQIITYVVNSSNGATNFARTRSVCKSFMELAEDKDILKAVVFDNTSVPNSDGSFWSLLNKCANAGSWTAFNLVVKDLKERKECLKLKMRAIVAAKEDFLEKTVAVRVQRTRVRVRAAELAEKEMLEMIVDAKTDAVQICKEITERLERIVLAAIPQELQSWWYQELRYLLSPE